MGHLVNATDRMVRSAGTRADLRLRGRSVPALLARADEVIE